MSFLRHKYRICKSARNCVTHDHHNAERRFSTTRLLAHLSPRALSILVVVLVGELIYEVEAAKAVDPDAEEREDSRRLHVLRRNNIRAVRREKEAYNSPARTECARSGREDIQAERGTRGRMRARKL